MIEDIESVRITYNILKIMYVGFKIWKRSPFSGVKKKTPPVCIENKK